MPKGIAMAIARLLAVVLSKGQLRSKFCHNGVGK